MVFRLSKPCLPEGDQLHIFRTSFYVELCLSGCLHSVGQIGELHFHM